MRSLIRLIVEQSQLSIICDDAQALNGLAHATDATIEANDAIMLRYSYFHCLVLTPVSYHLSTCGPVLIAHYYPTHFYRLARAIGRALLV